MKNPPRITLKADPESIQERVKRYKADAIKLRNENKKLAALYQAGVAEYAKLQKEAAKLQARYIAATMAFRTSVPDRSGDDD